MIFQFSSSEEKPFEFKGMTFSEFLNQSSTSKYIIIFKVSPTTKCLGKLFAFQKFAKLCSL